MVAGLAMAVVGRQRQRIMMFALPVIFTPFIIGFPAGLILYWITTNIWTIGQQYAVKLFHPGAGSDRAGGGAKAAKPPPPPPRRRRSGARAGSCLAAPAASGRFHWGRSGRKFLPTLDSPRG